MHPAKPAGSATGRVAPLIELDDHVTGLAATDRGADAERVAVGLGRRRRKGRLALELELRLIAHGVEHLVECRAEHARTDRARTALLRLVAEVDDPERVQQPEQQARSRPPWLPPGAKGQSEVLRLMGEAGHMLQLLNNQLARDWPASFLQVRGWALGQYSIQCWQYIACYMPAMLLSGALAW